MTSNVKSLVVALAAVSSVSAFSVGKGDVLTPKVESSVDRRSLLIGGAAALVAGVTTAGSSPANAALGAGTPGTYLLTYL
jgi:hypothetical protein